VKSIFTVFKGKAPKSTRGSLEGVSPGNAMMPDKEPNAVENFLAKSTRCVKDATSAATSSPVAPESKSLGMEMVLLTDLKCDALTGRINW
jgi:hypothetical protein